jgi:hypothetical protein
MRFNTHQTSHEHRFSIGIEETSGKPFLSIPVSNRLVDYEEHYRLSHSEFERFRGDMPSALGFVEKCRRRKLDRLLFLKPGSDRGVPS